jgi:hypothetical protein
VSIEGRLRAWGEEHRRSTTAPRVPVQHFEQASRGRRYAVIGAAAAVVLVVTGIVAVLDSRPQLSAPHARAPAGSNNRVSPALKPPPGMQSITFHGLTIQVPAAWPLNAARCGTPVADTVIIGDGSVAACAIRPTPRVTSALLSSFHGSYSLTGAPKKSITIGSTAAVRLDKRTGALMSTEIVLPSIKVDLLLRSPSQARIDALIHTLTLTSTDIYGCPSQSARVDLAERTGSTGGDLIPLNAVSVTVCRYLSEFLEEGRPVASAAVSHFVSLINALPAGLSVANPNDYLPALCHGHSGRFGYEDEEEYVIRVHYAGGQIRVLHARLGLCGSLGISDGSRGRQRTLTLCDLLVSLAGNATGIPSDVRMAK